MNQFLKIFFLSFLSSGQLRSDLIDLERNRHAEPDEKISEVISSTERNRDECALLLACSRVADGDLDTSNDTTIANLGLLAREIRTATSKF